SGIVAPYILHYGTEDQKKRWLPKLATGEMVGAIAMTEPGTGSDLQGVRANAKKSGNGYVLNGSKTFITNGQHANLIIVVAKTDPKAGAKGTSLFVVETDDAQGFRRGRKLKKLGMDSADTSELFFEDVQLPASSLLGTEEGQGFYQLMKELPQERLIVAVHAVAMMERALALTVDYVKQRKAFGQAIIEFQNTQFELAECKTDTTIAKVFLDHCIGQHVKGELDTVTASMAKYRLTDTQGKVIDRCLQLFGGYGYMDEYPISRMYRDARVLRIYAGTNEIMKLLIAEASDARQTLEGPMADAFIYDAIRTPRGRGKADGSLHEVTALNLAAQTLAAVKDRNKLDPALIDDVVLGCVDPVGEAGGDIARAAALVAGLGDDVPGVQINRFCASGLDAVNFAAAEVMSGQHEMTIGGGAESMSRVGIGASGGAWPVDPSIAVTTYFLPQGISADLIATKYGFSRDDVDAYAVESQKRAAKAWDEGRFKNSVIPVKDVNGLTILAKDEHMRPGTTMQTLASLQPSFVQMGEMAGFDAVAVQRYPEVEAVNHVHTPGNSSGIVDGAAAVLIGSKAAGKAAGLKPRARIRQFANIGSEPSIMLTGPIPVTEKVLKKAGMTRKDIDLWELNEAFASVVLRYMQALNISHDKINVNGGAIAMGHPLGATGAMILGTVLDELERRDKETALVTLCIGVGMGTATIIERV